MKTVLVNGLGCTGASVLVDYFKEFSNTTVIENEFELLRHSGGILELESAILSQNIFLIDSTVKRFLRLVDFLSRPPERYKEGRNYQAFCSTLRETAQAFLDNILLIQSETKTKIYNRHEYNDNSQLLRLFLHLISKSEKELEKAIFQCFLRLEPDLSDDSKVYYAKNLTEREYVEYAKEFLGINLSHCAMGNEYIVLDQAISTCSSKMFDSLKYFGNAKAILVYRDPRDVYMSGIIKGRGWVTTNTKEDFVNWVACHYMPLENINSEVLALKFEDIVLDYDNATLMIKEFIGIENSLHLNPQSIFIPTESAKNVGKWKRHPDQEIMNCLKTEFPEYCYQE